MYIANYFLQGEVSHGGLPQWLTEQTGLHGSSPEAYNLLVWINSAGGDVMAAIEAINLMRSSPVPITTVINGCAESAALLIAAAGHKRLVFENSWAMAHHFSTGMEGNYHELNDALKFHKLLNDTMTNIFVENSKLTQEVIETRLLGRANTWLGPKDLLEYGLVDEIVAPGTDLVRKILQDGKAEKSKKAKKHIRRKDSAETDG